MSPDDEIIRERLAPDEQLFWVGRPCQGLRLQPRDAFMIPFSLMWGGFAIFWETMAIMMGAPLFFWIWGIPFVLIGLYMIAGRFWVDRRCRAATFYGLTDRRVIIVSGPFHKTVTSLSLRTLGQVTMTERHDGSGTISFGPHFPFAQSGSTTWIGTPDSRTSLELAEDVRAVYEKIVKLQAVVSP